MTTHRRRFLRLCGVAGIGAIAGCSNSSQDSETPISSETTTEVKSPTATLTPTPDQPSTETPTETSVIENQEAKLAADDGDSMDSFSLSVALSSDGSTALIGASSDEDPNGENAGSAYVFDNSGGSWTQQTKLAPDDGDSEDFFGGSVSLSSDGTTALIGAEQDEDPNGNTAGSAYVFDSSGDSWTQQTKLAADDGDSYDQFGESVSLSSDGTTALIGARGDEDPNGREAGSAYVFE